MTVRIEVRAHELPLAQRFTIARESWDVAEVVYVFIRRGDVYGVGEVQPSGRWDESAESVVATLEDVDPARLDNPFDLEAVSEILPAGAARSALDIAAHDLAGKLAGISVSALLGIAGRPLPPTSVTVGIGDVEAMLERTTALKDHPVLKMKVGFDGDVEFIARARSIYDGRIRIDANEGWSTQAAIERLKELEQYDIELCEQPIPAKRYEELALVTSSTAIPIFADEDACTSADVAHLAGVVNGVNLKLRKAGGIRETVKGIAVARANGLGVMLGCDLVSGVAATAEAHLIALVDHADIDGPLLLKEDPYPGVTYDRGTVTLPEGPGLGLRRSP